MEASAIFEGILAPGERLLWSGRMVAVPLGFVIWGPILLVSGGVVSFVVPVIFGTIRRPIPTEGIIAICGFIGLGVLGCVLALMRSRTDARTTYAVTDRRLLCAVGDQRKAIRAVALTHLAGAEVRPSYGMFGAHGPNVEFSLLKEHSSLILPGMWRFVESGKPDAWRGRCWRVENPRFIVGLVGRAVVAIQAVER